MTDLAQANKRSFHIPATEPHVQNLIELVADFKGTTPSQWVYQIVIKKLQEAGLLDEKHQIVMSKYQELMAALPPGALEKREKRNGTYRSKKSA